MNEKMINDLHVMMGRLNGLHASLVCVASALPKDVAARAATSLQEGSERVVADLLGLPIPDKNAEEMQRVMLEMAGVLRTTAQSQ